MRNNPRNQSNIFEIQPTGTPNVSLSSEDLSGDSQYIRGTAEAQLITQFAGTEREKETVERNQEKLNNVISNVQEIKETFGNVLPWSKAFKNIETQIFRDYSLTGAIYRDLTRKRVDPKEALSEEEFKSSPFYYQGMQFPSFPINYAEQKKMYDNMQNRQLENDLAVLSSPAQKVGRFVASFGASIYLDPVVTLATGLTGVATKSVATAALVSGIENLLFDEIIDFTNKDQLALEGINKTPEERNIERTQAFLFGAGIGAGSKAISNFYTKYKIKKGQKEPITTEEQIVQDIQTAPETNIETNPNLSQQVNTTNEFSDFYTTETVAEQVKRRGLTLEEREQLIRVKEEEKRKTIQVKEEEKRKTLELSLENLKQKTTEQKFDKVQSILQAKGMLDESVNLNSTKVAEIEQNTNNTYTRTNQSSSGIYLPETLEVNGLSQKTLNIKYKVVDLSTLIYSNNSNGTINPNYPKIFQPRDREKDFIGLSRINKNANNLSNNKLIYNAGSISLGSPIITKDNVVIAGNGRSMSLELAYARNKANHYSDELKTRFSQFDYEGIERPVLVREIVDNLNENDLQKLAKSTNLDEVDPYTQLETIKNDALTLEEDNIILLYQGGDVASENNSAFFNEFFRRVPEEELKKYLNDKGLTIDGKERIQKAIVYSAYKNENLLNQMYIWSDNDISKNIADTIIQFSPKIIQLKRLIKQEIVPHDFDISGNISNAFELYYFDTNKQLAYNLNQKNNIFGEPFTDPVTETIVRGFFKDEDNLTKIANKEDIKKFLNNYYNLAINTRNLGIIESIETQTKVKDLLDLAKTNKEKVIVEEKPQIENVPNVEKELELKFKKEYTQTDIETWSEGRKGTKEGFKGMQSQTKKLIQNTKEALTAADIEQLYKDEANLLNFALFKIRAGEWREAFPQLNKNGRNIRDYATTNELLVLDELQSLNASLMQNPNLTKEDRLNQLTVFADEMMGRLEKENPDGNFRLDMAKRQAELENMEKALNETPSLKEEYLQKFKEEENLLARINDYFSCRLKK